MPLDVHGLQSFYGSPLGAVARRLIGRVLRERWESASNLSVAAIGYGTPYVDRFRDGARRCLAFMPAEQGVVHWPPQGRPTCALVDPTMMPLPDAAIDRILVAHSLETSEHPRDLLEEIWRVMAPGGRVIFVVPSRSGLWARLDTTPFGQGHPYSRLQLRHLLQETLFLPIFWGEALYVPPFESAWLLSSAPAFERIAGRWSLPGGGVLVVEATKQLYKPISLRRTVRRSVPQLEPALEPVGAA